MLIVLCSGALVLLVAGALVQSARLETGAIALVVVILVNAAGLEREIGLSRQAMLVVQEGLLLSLLFAWLFRVRRLTRWQLWLVVFSAFAVLASLTSGLPVGISAAGLRLALLPLGALLIGSAWRRGGPAAASCLVLVSMVPAVLLGFRQALLGFTPAELAALSSAEATYIVGDTFRLVGASGTGQEFSMLLVLTALCGTWLLLERTGWRGRCGAAAAVSSSVLVALSLQRLALVALASGLLALILFAARSRTWRRGVLQLCVVAFGGVVAAVVLAPERVEDASSRLGTLASVGGDESFLLRVTEVWPRAWEIILARPVTGWGAGSAGVLTVRSPWEFTNGAVVADNMALHLGVQFGLVGLLLFVVFLVQYWRALEGEGAPLGRATVIAIAVAGVVGTVLGLYAFMVVSCMVLGACVRPRQAASREPDLAPAPEHACA